MNDPERLLKLGATDSELALLRAGLSEEPPADGPQRLAHALGLTFPSGPAPGSPGGADPATPHGQVAAETAQSGTMSVAPGAALGGLSLELVAKWLALATTAGVITSVALLASQPRVPDARPQPAPLAAPVEVRAAGAQTAAPAGEPEEARPAKPQPAALGRQATRRTPGSIALEVAALDQARRALHGADPEAALASLERYAQSYPRGALRQEAALLRIEALLAAERRAAAVTAGERFVREHPDSPHAARVRALLERDAP